MLRIGCAATMRCMSGSVVSGIACTPGVQAEIFESLDSLPTDCAALFAEAPFQSSEAWWRCTVNAALPAHAVPLFVLVRNAGRMRALLPLQQLGRNLSGLTTPYTCLYQPLIAADADAGEIRRIGQAMGRVLRRWPSLRLDALDAD